MTIQSKYNELINTTINELTIKSIFISKYDKNSHPILSFECNCSCGTVGFKTLCRSVVSGRTKTCGCRTNRKPMPARPQCCGEGSKLYKGYRDISGHFWSGYIRSAIRRNHIFEITKEQIWELYEKQQRKCILSGVDIHFSCNDKLNTASIDRIDSSIGYVIENIQLVHKIVNIMKQKNSDKEFIEWCRLIVNHKDK